MNGEDWKKMAAGVERVDGLLEEFLMELQKKVGTSGEKHLSIVQGECSLIQKVFMIGPLKVFFRATHTAAGVGFIEYGHLELSDNEEPRHVVDGDIRVDETGDFEHPLGIESTTQAAASLAFDQVFDDLAKNLRNKHGESGRIFQGIVHLVERAGSKEATS